jgi:hypothetical protein
MYTPNLLSSARQIPGSEAPETAGKVSGTHLGTHPAVKPGIFDTNGTFAKRRLQGVLAHGLFGKTRGGAYGIRTRVTAVRGRRPRPLDECALRRSMVPTGLLGSRASDRHALVTGRKQLW